MSPVSCLVRYPLPEKQKKRVTFSTNIYYATEPDHPPLGFDRDVFPAETTTAPSATILSSLAGERVSGLGSLTPVTSSDLRLATIQPETWCDHPTVDHALPTSGPEAIRRGIVRPRWWRHKLSSLDLPAPCTVAPSMTCQDAMDIMRQQRYNQLPVVDPSGELRGVVTLRGLMSTVLVCRADTSTPVAQVMERDYETVTRDDTLGTLSELFEERDFILLVRLQRRLTETREVASKEILIGVVTHMDLLTHVLDKCGNL